MNLSSRKRAYTLISIIMILLITSGIGLVNFQEQRKLEEAKVQQAIAEAVQADQAALEKEDEAHRQARLAEVRKFKAINAQAEAASFRKDADEKRRFADDALLRAKIAEDRAKAAEAEARQQQMIADKTARSEMLISLGRSLAIKSHQLMVSSELQALMAVQAYKFHVASGGAPQDVDIHDGLSRAVGRFSDPILTDSSGSENVQALVYFLCSRIKRNLTLKEWQEYVGADIPYEKTCEDLSQGH